MQELEKILEEIEIEENRMLSDLQLEVSQRSVNEMRKYVQGLRYAKAIIRKHMNDGWIPVEERLPEEKGVYLVTYHPCYWDNVEAEVRVGIDTFRGKTAWAQRKYQRVIAWRPLPEPYRPEGKENIKQ